MITHEEAEMAVLGAVFLKGDALLQASDIITATDFHRPGHVDIWSAMLDCYELDGVVDVLTVSRRLEAKELLVKVGGSDYLAHLADTVPTAANVEHHARSIAEAALRRRLKYLGMNYAELAERDGARSAQEIMGALETDLMDLAGRGMDAQSPYARDHIAGMRDWRRRIQAGEVLYIKPEDHYRSRLKGFFPGHGICISGETSGGKSALANEFMLHLHRLGERPLVFSLEDTVQEKLAALAGGLANVPKGDILAGELHEIDEDQVRQAEERIAQWNPIVYDYVYTVEQMVLKMKRHAIQDGVRVVFVDYMQLLQGQGNEYEVLTDAIKTLMQAAKRLGVTLIYVSQLNTDGIKGSMKLGLMGSRALEYAAHMVIKIKWLKKDQCPSRYVGRAIDAMFEKNRAFGKTGPVPLAFNEKYTRIEHRDTRQEEIPQ